jgi:hypothetical protein
MIMWSEVEMLWRVQGVHIAPFTETLDVQWEDAQPEENISKTGEAT